MRLPTIVLCILFAAGIGATGSPAQDQKKATPRPQAKSESTSSMSGCVDQQDGRYVLVDDRGLNKITDLVPDGFPVEGFAKHVGHKVIVRGTTTTGEKPSFKVRAVETVSDICAPGNNQQGRQ